MFEKLNVSQGFPQAQQGSRGRSGEMRIELERRGSKRQIYIHIYIYISRERQRRGQKEVAKDSPRQATLECVCVSHLSP